MCVWEVGEVECWIESTSLHHSVGDALHVLLKFPLACRPDIVFALKFPLVCRPGQCIEAGVRLSYWSSFSCISQM